MILDKFAKYIQTKDEDIISNKSTAVNILSEWIIKIMSKKPRSNVEKIIHSEITLAKNKYNEFLIIGKSESGRVLINALYNYALSYEHYVLAKTIQH